MERKSIPLLLHFMGSIFSVFLRTDEGVFSIPRPVFTKKKENDKKETNIPLYQYYSLNDYVTKENGSVLCNLFSLMFMTRNGNK